MRWSALSLGAVLLLSSAGLEAQQRGAARAGAYRVDAAASDLRLLVYRAGPLARAGHNHVVSIERMEGRVLVEPGLAQSSFELTIPVDALRVDDPAMRREEGAEFASEPSPRDVEQTRANMLGPRVLDAGRYSDIRVTGRWLSESAGEAQLALSLTLLGQSRALTVPATLSFEADLLEASGAFPLSHETLGLAPFRVLLGALQVADEMQLKFRIVARSLAEP